MSIDPNFHEKKLPGSAPSGVSTKNSAYFVSRGSGGSSPPPFFYFRGKLKIPKSNKREEKETDHGLTTPPFPSLSFFNAH
jgi:hypothetical protein